MSVYDVLGKIASRIFGEAVSVLQIEGDRARGLSFYGAASQEILGRVDVWRRESWAFGVDYRSAEEGGSFVVTIGPLVFFAAAGSDRSDYRVWKFELSHEGDWYLDCRAGSLPITDPRHSKRSANVNLTNLLFGEPVTEIRSMWSSPVSLRMPEGEYLGVGSLKEYVTKWPRWPLAHYAYCEHVEFDQGIPLPDDAIYSTSVLARGGQRVEGVQEALATLRSDALEERGGERWRPERRMRRVILMTNGQPMFNDSFGVHGFYEYELRDPLTGQWNSIGYCSEHSSETIRDLDEPFCGCCDAEYGVRCKSVECSNYALRRENGVS